MKNKFFEDYRALREEIEEETGKLTKDHINNRGYNKYLKLSGEVNITIDYEKYEADSIWDGLKGYVTNTHLPRKEVIGQYSQAGRESVSYFKNRFENTPNIPQIKKSDRSAYLYMFCGLCNL